MAEIKSTLDLVMEKTSHLTASDEEKKAQKRQEIEKQIRGLLLKYQDNLVKKESLKDKLADLRAVHDDAVDEMLKQVLLTGISLDEDNAKRLELLNDLSGLDVKALESLISDYNEAILASAEQGTAKITEMLSGQYHISGPAVVPNLEKDAEWIEEARGIRRRFEKIFLEEKEKLKKSNFSP